MKTHISQFFADVRQPYLRALLLLALVPLFPEYISFFLVLFALFFAIKDVRKDERSLKIGTIGKLLMAFCAYQTFTCIISTHPLQSLGTSLMWWFFLLAYLMLVNLLTSRDRLDTFLLYLTSVAALVGLIACIQYRINYFTENSTGNIWRWLDELVYPYIPFDIVELNYFDRACSTFDNPNIMAKYLVMVAPFVACFNFIERRNSLRIYSRICLFLTFAGVIFSFSRGGYLAMIALAVALIILNFRKKFAAISLYVVSTLLFLPSEVVNRLFSIKDGVGISSNIVSGSSASSSGTTLPPATVTEAVANNAVSERWQIWSQALTKFSEQPIFGYGAGTQPSYEIFHEIGIKAAHSHNIVLQLLLEGGIIALLLMGVLGFQTIKHGFHLLFSHQKEAFWVGFGICGFVACFLIHGMVDYPFSTPKLVFTFITMLALAEQGYSLYRRHNKEKTKAKKETISV